MAAIKRLSIIVAGLLLGCCCASALCFGQETEKNAQASKREKAPAMLRLGIIGLDTSHVVQFARLLNDPSNPEYVPGARIVAAYKGGSPDVENSARRIEQFTAEIRDKWGVEIVNSIEELCQKVDAVMLMSVDGRTHLKQIRPVFAAKKIVFIDKPFAGNFREAREIVRLGRASGTPFFSSSPRRFSSDILALKDNSDVGKIIGASTFGPSPLEPHVPDLFWYGIHSIESLYTIMGTGCVSVTRVHTNGTDVVVGRWKDGRIGVMRGIREGDESYGAVVFGSKAVMASPSFQQRATETSSGKRPPPPRSNYHGIVAAVVKFFQTRVPPVAPEETLEIMAFMQAADLSKERGGTPVALAEILDGGSSPAIAKPSAGKTK